MGFWAPHEKTRQVIKFWVDCLQGIAVLGGIITIAVTYIIYTGNRRLELEKPFYEKQLELYADAARVAGQIAVIQAAGHQIDEDTENRFWGLYYGELVLVESQGDGSIAMLMNKFCSAAFPNAVARCSRLLTEKAGNTPTEKLAIEIAMKAREEIKARWK